MGQQTGQQREVPQMTHTVRVLQKEKRLVGPLGQGPQCPAETDAFSTEKRTVALD